MDIVSVLVSQAIPIAVLLLVVVVIGLAVTIARNYHKVAPNEVAVVSGRSRRSGDGRVGYRVITGGGFFLIPVLERVDYLSLNLMTFPVQIDQAPDKNGAPVTVRAIANVKILSTAEALPLAIERFLSSKMDQVQQFAKENLESNLRAIVGTLAIEDLIRDRSALQAQVTKEAVSDLAKLGLGVDLLNVQEVRDDRGYIDALGQTKTAEVKRDAAIGKAEAERDAKVKASDAAQRGEAAAAKAEQQISDARRERDIAIAENAAKTQAAAARVSIAAQIAAQEETARLNEATVHAEMRRIAKETELQALEQERRDAELRATIIVQAERDKEARVIAAQATQEAAVREGEALRIKAEKDGQGQQAKAIAVAEGRKATAAALQAEKLAEAAGALALWQAEAEGARLKLLAEAEGATKKAEAFRQLDEAGRFLMILEASPSAIAAAGAALASVIQPAADAIGTGLGNIKEVRVVDLGGGQRNGTGAAPGLLREIANMPVETIVGLIEKAKAAGLGDVVDRVVGASGLLMAAPPQRTSASKPNGAEA